mmetsp:Transcript_106514/g.183643  ORF Transcript_106514/g.183643 Transcript_106514/m.183643 type:complete len:91 (-) Transcript_106514:318-590(-)
MCLGPWVALLLLAGTHAVLLCSPSPSEELLELQCPSDTDGDLSLAGTAVVLLGVQENPGCLLDGANQSLFQVQCADKCDLLLGSFSIFGC